MALRMALRTPEEAGPDKPRVGYRRSGGPPQRLTPARARVIEALGEGVVLAKSALAAAARCSPGVIDGLVDEGTLDHRPDDAGGRITCPGPRPWA